MTTRQELGQRDPWRERLKKALPFGNGNGKDCCHAGGGGGGSGGACHGGLQVDTRGLRKLAILGSPNAGKSALFNRLTGAYVTVSNYPGTTVEVSRGKARINGEEFEVVDTPGMYSLLPISEEEKVARDILLREKPALVLNVVDGKNLERLLALTLQLVEADLPLLLVLNMMDEADEAGVKVDREALEAALGVPVVATVATSGEGMDALKSRIYGYLSRQN